jgi:hypothetical protein
VAPECGLMTAPSQHDLLATYLEVLSHSSDTTSQKYTLQRRSRDSSLYFDLPPSLLLGCPPVTGTDKYRMGQVRRDNTHNHRHDRTLARLDLEFPPVPWLGERLVQAISRKHRSQPTLEALSLARLRRAFIFVRSCCHPFIH